jgi:hypothetical protein
MTGEAHDYEYPYSEPISLVRAESSAHVLEAALVWLLIYYAVILPCNLIPLSKAALWE